MIEIDIPTGVRTIDGTDPDKRKKRWDNKAAALDGIPAGVVVVRGIPMVFRYIGLTVPLMEGGEMVEYWFTGGVTNEHFKLKTNKSTLILPDMILTGGETTNTGVDPFEVTVEPTSWLINNTTYRRDTDKVLTLAAADPLYNRIDLIVANTANDMQVIKGIAEDNYLAPNLPANMVLVRAIVVTPDTVDVQTPEPVTASNLIPPFQTRRQYKKYEPITVAGVGIYTAKQNFRSSNAFVLSDWELVATISGSATFASIAGDPYSNTPLAAALNSKTNTSTFNAAMTGINEDFEHIEEVLIPGKVDKVAGSSLVDDDEILRLAGVTNQDLTGLQVTSQKDATGGYVGLTGLAINFRNALNTFTSFFTNANTAARTYTFPDKDGTVAMLDDLGGGGAALPLRVMNVSLLSTGWALVAGVYEYVYNNVAITANSIVDVVPQNGSVYIVQAAEVMPLTTPAAGSVKLFSKYAPTANITVNVYISESTL